MKIELTTQITSQSKTPDDVKLSLRAYLSAQHLWIAKYLVEQVHNIEEVKSKEGELFDDLHRGFTLNSIFSSVAFLESYINEVFQDATDESGTYLKSLDQNTRSKMSHNWANQLSFSAGILTKYQFALDAAGKSKFVEQDQIYENVDLAIELRNSLTHFKPSTKDGSGTEGIDLRLNRKTKLHLGSNRFPHNKLMANTNNPFFPDKCLGYGCAKWVLDSCQNLADEFSGRMNITPHYQQVKYT